MAAVSIWFSFFLLCLVHVASCSGTFYRKVSDDEDDADISTRGFHQCSLINGCKIVGIPVADAGSKVYSAATMKELENVGEKLGIWKKVELEDSKESVEDLKSCKDAMNAGMKESGTVKISSSKNTKIEVFCDMKTDEGGWIVFQRRVNSSVSFEKNWQAYENGFGNLKGNFWLGLKALHSLTSSGRWTLRIDLKSANGDRGYAKYTDFKIGSEESKYKLMIGEYSGNIKDGLKPSKGMKFTTYDNDNDLHSGNCASIHKGGWWHKCCFAANLNNWHPTKKNAARLDVSWRISWQPWKSVWGGILFSEMKMKIEN